MKKIIHLIVSYFIFSIPVCAQECVVSMDPLKGEYSGGCKKGKAEGIGTAKGTDTYTGEFKNGYPDGKGKYSWKNGDWFEGAWKKGSFDGQGTLHKIITMDSAVETTGFWEKGKYLGKYARPYKINSQSNAVTSVDIRKTKSDQSTIIITVKSLSRSTTVQGQNYLPKYKLTDIQIAEGRYDQLFTDELSSPLINKYTLQKVFFPFKATLIFETVGALPQKNSVSIEIFEDASWTILVNIDN